MTHQQMEARIVRYGDLRPCMTAFIDAHTPGSDQKENFTIIGGGVSESPDQHVHIVETPGFNTAQGGPASQVPHTPAQPPQPPRSFFRPQGALAVLLGRWGRVRSCWKRATFFTSHGIFPASRNRQTDYGMMHGHLGGDGRGRRRDWAPTVIEDARAHGPVVLGKKRSSSNDTEGPAPARGRSAHADSERGRACQLPRTRPTPKVIPRFRRRYWTSCVCPPQPRTVITAADVASCANRLAFEVEFLSRGSIPMRP